MKITRFLAGLVCAMVGTEIMNRHFGVPHFDLWEFGVFVSYSTAGAILWANT